MALAVSMMAAAQAQGEWVALIDAADAFDPYSAAAAGMALDSLLWVRPVAASFKLGLVALDRVLWAGGFGLTVLYLAGGAVGQRERRFSNDEKMIQNWVRMSRQAERAKSAVLVVSDGAVTGSMSYVTLACQRTRARFSGRLFKAAETKIEVTRSKKGWPPAAAHLSLAAQ
jgi:hypothetical protein